MKQSDKNSWIESKANSLTTKDFTEEQLKKIEVFLQTARKDMVTEMEKIIEKSRVFDSNNNEVGFDLIGFEDDLEKLQSLLK